MVLYQHLIKRHPTHSAYATAWIEVSVAAASNFFTTHIQPTTSGVPAMLWIQYATATNSALELILDDATRSTNASLRIEDTMSTVASANMVFHYWITVPPNTSYNFSPSIGGTVMTFECYEVNLL